MKRNRLLTAIPIETGLVSHSWIGYWARRKLEKLGHHMIYDATVQSPAIRMSCRDCHGTVNVVCDPGLWGNAHGMRIIPSIQTVCPATVRTALMIDLLGEEGVRTIFFHTKRRRYYVLDGEALVPIGRLYWYTGGPILARMLYDAMAERELPSSFVDKKEIRKFLRIDC